jgi:catechol 2,3-dioxygenase-like lactoylglutathione lyase family enzyme
MAGAKGKTKKKPPAKVAAPAKKPVERPRPAAKPAPAPRARAVAPEPTPIISAAPPKPHTPPRPLIKGDFVLDRLHQVALTATNLDLAVEFYRDILGLKFIARFDPPGLAFFTLSGGTRLLLSATASQASLYFFVDNLDDAVRELKKRGVSFLHPPSMIHRDDAGNFGKKGNQEWMAFLKDPSGNLLGLVEKR